MLGSPGFCTVAWTILPPRVVYGRIATSHSPSSSVNQSPILNCIGSTRVAAGAAACCGAGNGSCPSASGLRFFSVRGLAIRYLSLPLRPARIYGVGEALPSDARVEAARLILSEHQKELCGRPLRDACPFYRRRLVHFNVTEHPTAEWTARQLIEGCGQEESPRHMIRDRDQVYGERFSRQARLLDIREAVIAPRSPWQNAYAERVIGSIRRECLDHVVVLGERHLLGILSKYVDYYNGTRTHLSLAKDAPESRSVQPPSQGPVVAVPRVGGLHHEYLRHAA